MVCLMVSTDVNFQLMPTTDSYWVFNINSDNVPLSHSLPRGIGGMIFNSVVAMVVVVIIQVLLVSISCYVVYIKPFPVHIHVSIWKFCV